MLAVVPRRLSEVGRGDIRLGLRHRGARWRRARRARQRLRQHLEVLLRESELACGGPLVHGGLPAGQLGAAGVGQRRDQVEDADDLEDHPGHDHAAEAGLDVVDAALSLADEVAPRRVHAAGRAREQRLAVLSQALGRVAGDLVRHLGPPPRSPYG